MKNSKIVDEMDFRESLIKQGVILTVAPLLSVIALGPVSAAFSRPNPWPIKSLIGIVLIAGMVSGPWGLQLINRGRAAKYDGLGICCLALLLVGTFLYMLFLSGAFLAYSVSFYGLVPFGGR